MEGNAEKLVTYRRPELETVESSMSFGDPITALSTTCLFPVLSGDKETDLIIGDSKGNIIFLYDGR